MKRLGEKHAQANGDRRAEQDPRWQPTGRKNAVCPTVARRIPQCNERNNHRRRPKSSEETQHQRPKRIELLLGAERPRKIENATIPFWGNEPGVGVGKEAREIVEKALAAPIAFENQYDHYVEGDCGVIKRPYPQRSPDVEIANRDFATTIAFSEQ